MFIKIWIYRNIYIVVIVIQFIFLKRTLFKTIVKLFSLSFWLSYSFLVRIKNTYTIYIYKKKKKIHKSMSNNYCTKYSSPHNPLPTILACSLVNCPKLNQALAIFPFLSLFLWLSRISFLILTLLKSKLLTNLIKLIHGINSFNPPNISLHGAS